MRSVRPFVPFMILNSTCCAVYSAIANNYDYPSTVADSATRCSYYLYHDASLSSPVPSPWVNSLRPFPQDVAASSGKLQVSGWKLRRPADLTECAHTMFIDANVDVKADPTPLFDTCKSLVCMFSFVHDFEGEIKWLQQKGFASATDAAHLKQQYAAHLAEPSYYSKVIVRNDDGSGRLECFESRWLAALASAAVQRDQVHINAAAAACGVQIGDLATPGRLDDSPSCDPRFQEFLANRGTHKKHRAHGAERAPGKLKALFQGIGSKSVELEMALFHKTEAEIFAEEAETFAENHCRHHTHGPTWLLQPPSPPPPPPPPPLPPSPPLVSPPLPPSPPPPLAPQPRAVPRVIIAELAGFLASFLAFGGLLAAGFLLCVRQRDLGRNVPEENESPESELSSLHEEPATAGSEPSDVKKQDNVERAGQPAHGKARQGKTQAL